MNSGLKSLMSFVSSLVPDAKDAPEVPDRHAGDRRGIVPLLCQGREDVRKPPYREADPWFEQPPPG